MSQIHERWPSIVRTTFRAETSNTSSSHERPPTVINVVDPSLCGATVSSARALVLLASGDDGVFRSAHAESGMHLSVPARHVPTH